MDNIKHIIKQHIEHNIEHNIYGPKLSNPSKFLISAGIVLALGTIGISHPAKAQASVTSQIPAANTQAPTNQAVGNGAQAPANQAAGTGAQAPTNQAAGNGAQGPTNQAVGNGAQAPANQAAGTGAQAPTNQAAGNGAQAPANQAVGNGTQAPTSQAVGKGAQAPTNQAAGNGAQAPANQAAGKGAQAPTNQAAGNGAQAPTNQAAGTGAQAPANQAAGKGAQAPANQAAGKGAQAPANQAAGTGAQAPANQAAGKGAQAPTKQTAGKGAQAPTANQTQVTATSLQDIEKSDPHIKTINGQTYFIEDDGQIKKNFTAIVDGQVLYFDKDTGALASNNEQYSTGLVNIGNEHNAAYSASPSSFTQIDGYLTAGSWYRPKDILKDGTTWTPSTSVDFRPLLMTWWPDKNTQLAYLKYAQKNNLLTSDVNLSDSSKEEDLTNDSMLVQENIEKEIGSSGNTDWLETAMTQFIDSQSNWNINSESKGTDHLQGGALLYVNSDSTPNANSDYRLLNRTPTNQEGQITDTSKQGGFEMLLANDVDNSNPIVQAEQLNWLYYMMNIGTITNNDPSANFDGYRVDAVDNVDADLLQIAGDYFKDAYGTNKNDNNADNHLSILEDWDTKDPNYVKEHGNDQLTMDFLSHLSIKYSLNMPTNERSGLEPELTNSLVDRRNDSTENVAQPNYSFIRAHDSEVQTVIAQIVKDKINPDSDGLTVSQDEIAEAFKIYNEDELQANKQYTAYNIPASYALLLTNKDSIPRVYYGDLFTDDGQYMSQHSPYYDAITALLKARIKYVAGGQNMSIQYVKGDSSMSNSSYKGVLTSVRYGKGAMTASDQGTAETRTEGMAVIISNNPNLRLDNSDEIVVNMGIAHKNQAYRPVLLTTQNGLQRYSSDDRTPIIYTNSLGQLIFRSNSIYGVSIPQVSGYLAVWVPVGASNDQDARTVATTAASTDGNVYHSNAALDSQVIYEGFSNFQAMPTQANEYTNVKIAQNAPLFKEWGITSYELAPQYRSSTDGSFLDSVIQNGYAFTDRYDIGYGTPTKYGTAEQLLDAIRALHAQGIQAIDDWVPDQIYNLPGEEIVTATRTNGSGVYDYDSVIDDTLYDSQTVGGGKYQEIYGGAFLDELKQLYPDLFKTKQISTGQPMNPNVKITDWSAKYFNGSNIQGRGAWYVLKDWGTNKYFCVSSDSTYLPKQLLGEKTSTGFVDVNNQTEFYTTSGYQAKNTFIQDGDNWYYFDDNGYMVKGGQAINGNNYYFLPNGIELKDAYLSDGTKEYYYGKNGKQIMDQYYEDPEGDWRYFFKDGSMAKGLTNIELSDGSIVTQYFDSNGVQVKGDIVRNSDGSINYYTRLSGELLKNDFGELPDGTWVYLDKNGVAVTGKQEINGQTYYFNADGTQVKNDFAELPNGSWIYLDKNGVAVTGKQEINGQTYYFNADGTQIKSNFALLPDGSGKYLDNTWVYLDKNGVAVTGKQEINGQKLYFGSDGIQVKNDIVKNSDGTINYYTGVSGDLLKNDFGELPDGTWVYLDKNGVAVTGKQEINGQKLYFRSNGIQVKGDIVKNSDGTINYYTGQSGDLLKNDFGELPDGSWVYLDKNGVAVTGKQKINGKMLYFRSNGIQVKGDIVRNSDGTINYYGVSGELLKNDFGELPDGTWVYLDKNGVAVTGKQEINGQTYYFNADGTQVKNNFAELPDGSWIYLDKNGVAVTGKQEINGKMLYFRSNGIQVKGDIVRNSDGSINYYTGLSGELLKNDFGELPDGSWVYLDKNGVAVTGKQKINGKMLYFKSNGIQVKGKWVFEEDGSRHYYDQNSGEELN